LAGNMRKNACVIWPSVRAQSQQYKNGDNHKIPQPSQYTNRDSTYRSLEYEGMLDTSLKSRNITTAVRLLRIFITKRCYFQRTACVGTFGL